MTLTLRGYRMVWGAAALVAFVVGVAFAPQAIGQEEAPPLPEDKIVVVKSKPDAPYHHWIRVTSMIEEAGGIITILREEEREVRIPG